MGLPEQPRDLYQLQVENSLGLLCVHDMNGVLLSVNPAVARSLGYAVEEGIGKNLREFLAPAVRHLFDDYLQRIHSRTIVSGLMRLVAKDGTERIWFYRNTRHERRDQPPVILGHALDVTRRVHAESDLAEAKKALQRAHDELAGRVADRTRELEESNERLRVEMGQRRQVEQELLRARQLESLGVLAGGIAHDFNNFLTVVQGNIALAKIHLASDSRAHDVLDQAGDACRQAASLANQLLTFAKGGAPVRRIVSMAGILRATVDLVSAGSTIAMELHLADNLWPAEVDPEQIRQALHNVLLNAREALSSGGRIQVRAVNRVISTDSASRKAGSYVRISIDDDGPGIPPEILPKIFDPYFTTKTGGSGLGLATAYAIISRHEGHIGVESLPGVRTCFTIDLPAAPSGVPEEPVWHQPIQTGSGRILVMDDNEALRSLLAQMLERLGYEVELAANGDDALAQFGRARAANRAFAAVLLDLTIPGGMGGVPTAARLRELDASVKLIVSSGYSDSPVMADYRRFGFDAVVPKPWSVASLGGALKRLLG